MSSSSSFSASNPSEHSIFSSLSSFRQFSLNEIIEATGDFDKKHVFQSDSTWDMYLAKIHYGESKSEKVCASVKRFHADIDDGLENEVHIATKVQHPNIISLLGYCNESGEKILIYEYMEKGSLAAYVKTDNALHSTWIQRLKICLDVASGLRHLHEKTDECQEGMIHRNVKPAIILLDDNWVAKVSDFGLLMLSSSSQTNSFINSGTAGYLAPEYVFFKHVSTKVDVYAFGITMFEVLCRRRKWDVEADLSDYSYMDENENVGLLARENVDIQIKDDISKDCLKMFTNTIGECLQKDPNNRPTMEGVVRLLETALMFQEGEDEQTLNDHLKDVTLVGGK